MIKFSGMYASLAVAALLAGAPVQAQQLKLGVAPSTPVMLAGKKQNVFLKVSLTGFDMAATGERTPVNIAIVLDKSGSMSGDKIYRAREAAAMAINRLNANDIASVVAYDTTVRVPMPATKVSDKPAFRRAIERIDAGGNTALFAGVSKGAHEITKFLDPNRVNRIILLSDGLANVGPSSPAELGRLGASLAKEGISVTTIGLGLGYNEDLMTQLAGMSDGNHAFVENADDLARIFNSEFGDVLAVVAQEVEVKIQCALGVRPVRVLGRDADIVGRAVHTNLNQLYSEQEKFVLLEVEVPPGSVGREQPLASVEVSYTNMATRVRDTLNGAAAVGFSASDEAVVEATDEKVMTTTVEQIANEMSKEAVQLRDAGRVEEAKRKLSEGAEFVQQKAKIYGYRGEALQSLSAELEQDAEAVADDEDWNRTRKDLRKKQYSRDIQQRY